MNVKFENIPFINNRETLNSSIWCSENSLITYQNKANDSEFLSKNINFLKNVVHFLCLRFEIKVTISSLTSKQIKEEWQCIKILLERVSAVMIGNI